GHQRQILAGASRFLDAGGDGAEAEADRGGEALAAGRGLGVAQGAVPPRRSSPAVSASPNIRLAFWTACPAAPLTRLSMAAKAMATPRSGSASAAIRTRLVPTIACRRTASGLVARRNGRPATKAFTAAAASAPVFPAWSR